MAKTDRSHGWLHRALRFLDGASIGAVSTEELRTLLRQHGEEWKTPKALSLGRFVELATEHGKLKRIDLLPIATKGDKSSYHPIVRYAWGTLSPYQVALSIRKGAYLSHTSALVVHGLADGDPRTIFINREQSPKPVPSTPLSQEGIDRAFNNLPRVSNFVFGFASYRIVVISGKNTGNLGVSDLPGPDNTILPVTGLERTLIDVVVRPTYAGGPLQVLRAYTAAKDRLSVEKLLATLAKLEHVYPYHQAIGFYMERAGYPDALLKRLRKLGLRFDFHLANRMSRPRYSKDWRLFYPGDL